MRRSSRALLLVSTYIVNIGDTLVPFAPDTHHNLKDMDQAVSHHFCLHAARMLITSADLDTNAANDKPNLADCALLPKQRKG